jgi:Replication-relaxation
VNSVEKGIPAPVPEKPASLKPSTQIIRLQPRDVVLLAHLAIARYLTAPQIHQLVFPDCVDRISRRRIRLLSGGPAPLMTSLWSRTRQGDRLVAYRLTEQGFALAQEHLNTEFKIPAKDIGPEFLEHTLTLNELYVGLLLPRRPPKACDAAKLDPAAARQPFRWIHSESVRLPWTRYEVGNEGVASLQGKRIEPDAVLESPALARRWFFECEMGGHSVTNPDSKSGSSVAKLNRYAEFYSGFSDSSGKLTHYRKLYPDGWAAELVFLVPRQTRRDQLDQAFASWRNQDGQLSTLKSNAALRVRVLTFDEAPNDIRHQLGLDLIVPNRKVDIRITPEEQRRFLVFTAALYDAFKRVRAEARAAGRPEPAYPSSEDRDFALSLMHRAGVRSIS